MPRKITKFQIKKGFILFIQEQEGMYFLSWKHLDSFERDWPHGDNKILLHFVHNRTDATNFIGTITKMFGVKLKNVSKDFPSAVLVVEIV